MTIYALDHVQLSMPEGWEDMARAFYVDILGLSAQPKSDRHNKRSGVWFTTGTLKLHLSVDPEFRACHKAYPGLLVNGVEELADRCAAAGYSIAADEPIEGYKHVVVSDPFGNRLKLIEPLKLKVMMFQ
jgi:catechol 2,3-dioxygenase-like lactoylglutathione lyase family enzyme